MRRGEEESREVKKTKKKDKRAVRRMSVPHTRMQRR
jgi:hypothetical protein